MNIGMRLEQADHFSRPARLALQDALLALGEMR